MLACYLVYQVTFIFLQLPVDIVVKPNNYIAKEL